MTNSAFEQQATDDAVLAELGRRLAARRLDLELTQAAVAESAGIGKRTLERIEAGQTSQLVSLVRVLRVLDALPGLEALLPDPAARPMDLLKRQGKRRQRASRPSEPDASGEPWRWDDQT